ncbi:sulfatase family protein [Novipirellula sp. SH528]|uniref:sulfatase family protein n=1 Tax=Novipirellula sp. SH528 TaxID=3454466 RepID=UPI003FA140B4
MKVSGLRATQAFLTYVLLFSATTMAASRPNILFIVSEDNSEHLGCYGEDRVHTPHLDALAAGGVRYTRAYVPYSVCSPSRAAFLTGLYTRQTGHIGLATHRFSMVRDFKTMPAYFKQAGYYTGFLGKTHINPEHVVEDHVDHRAIRNLNFDKTISIAAYAEEAGTVIEKAAAREKPFLLIINYADAHRKFVRKSKHGFPTRQVEDDVEPFPWIGSDSPHLREELRDYFNCMNRLDEGVGMVLKKLDEAGAAENTLVVYISDHGADFPRGKGSIYENGTRIPMIVNYPKSFLKGKVEHAMVSTIDLLPTMLQAAGLPIPNNLPGIALQDIDSGKVPQRKYIHTFTTGSSPNLLYVQFGIRDERYKLVYNPDRALNLLAASRYTNSKLPEDQHLQSFLYPPEYELFDLQKDPYEWKNLADSAEHRDIRQRLIKAMQDFQQEIKDPFANKENVATFIAEQKEYLHKPYKKAGFRWPHLTMFEMNNQ